MSHLVDLPSDRLAQMRDELWSELKQPDSDRAKGAYVRLIGNISNPVSAQLVRHVRGARERQVCVNTIILWRRTEWLWYIGIVLLGLWKNWWIMASIPLLWLINNVVLNYLQTALNVELAARLFLLHVLTDEDPAFRERVFGSGAEDANTEMSAKDAGKHASPKQEATATEEAARAMCGAAMALHNQIESTLGGHKVQNRDFVEFMSELLCYFLHMLDRELSGTTNARVRTEALDSLIRQLCNEQYRILYDLGFEVTEEQVFGIIQDQYNQRQLEYSSIGKDWFQKVAARFGEHAANALGAPEEIRYEVAIKCCLLAPATYADLSSVLLHFQKSAWTRTHERPV